MNWLAVARAAAGPIVIIALMIWLTSWTGPNQPPAIAELFVVLLTSAPIALAWLGAAIGLGLPLRILLRCDGMLIQAGLGIAAMLSLDAGLGALGFLLLAGGIGAWVLTLAGLTILTVQLVGVHKRQRRRGINASRHQCIKSTPDASMPRCLDAYPVTFRRFDVWIFAAPAIAVLLVASCSAPGWLWATEFGGYDALSYHLQLPKEWMALGRIEPLPHNVYSFLPGYMEAAYYHIGILMGDSISAVYACQLLHASLAILTAACVGSLAALAITNHPDTETRSRDGTSHNHESLSPLRVSVPPWFRFGGRRATIGVVALLATPWVIVVGSLAYNEMAVLLMLATGLMVIQRSREPGWRTGATIGALAGAACGAKLTAIGFAAAPLGIAMLVLLPRRNWPGLVAGAVIAGLIVLSPYLVRNWLHAGNPVFPFATELFGTAHWTSEQAQIWMRGHSATGGVVERFSALWDQFLRYGIGPNPDANEPWKPQWSILPWLALIGFAIGLTKRESRRWAIALGLMPLIQIMFWLMFTHLKSRFLLPAAVPMATVAALGISVLLDTRSRRRDGETKCSRPKSSSLGLSVSSSLRSLIALALSIVPVFIFASENNRSPAAAIGQAHALTGDGLTDDARRELGSTLYPAIAVNHLLPPQSKVLMIGEAAPLYYRGDYTYNTTWDRGPLSDAIRRDPDNPAAWGRYLNGRGFTHVLLDPTMLEVWERASWNDPVLTRQNASRLTESFGELLYRYPSHHAIYLLQPPTKPSPGSESPPPQQPTHNLPPLELNDLSNWKPRVDAHTWDGALVVMRDNQGYFNGNFKAEVSRMPAGITFNGARRGIIFEDLTFDGCGEGVRVDVGEGPSIKDVKFRRVKLINCRTPDLDYPDESNHLMRSRGYAAYLAGVENWTFEDCELTTDKDAANGYALRVPYARNLIFRGGRLSNHAGRACIWLMSVDGVRIENAQIEGGEIRIGVTPENNLGRHICRDIVLDNCTIKHNTAMRPLTIWPESSNITLRNLNIFTEHDIWLALDSRNVSNVRWENIRVNGKLMKGFEGVQVAGWSVEKAVAAGCGPIEEKPDEK